MKRLLLTAALALPHLLLFAQAPSGVSPDLGNGDVRDVAVEDFPLTLVGQYASQRNGEIEFERAYGRHGHEGWRPRARRTGPPRRQPANRGPRSGAAPSSASQPAPANSKPLDGSLKVF